MVSTIDNSVFIEKFCEEAKDHIQTLNNGLLRLEKDSSDKEIIAEIFRAAHTLKGSARMVGLDDIGLLAHRMEDLLGAVKDGRVKFTPEIGDLLFVALDTTQLLLENPDQGAGLVDIPAVTMQLEKACVGEAVARKISKVKAPGKSVDASSLVSGEPPAQTNAKPTYESSVKTESAADSSTDASGDQAKADVDTEPVADKQPDVDRRAKATEDTRFGRRREDHEETIRVSTGKLDRLINMVGELAVNQIRALELNKDTINSVKQVKTVARFWGLLKEHIEVHESLTMTSEKNRLLESISRNIEDCAHSMNGLMRQRLENVSRFDNIVNVLEKEIFEVRMLPVGTILQNLPRAIRDMSREMGKEIEVVLVGEETELDKKMLEELNDPLVHMVRNSVDHGIEAPEDRVKAGKPRTGKIVIEAKQEGEHVEISVTDDGNGIEVGGIKNKVIKLGLASESDLDRMTDDAILGFLFQSGFTTKENVSEISGRGVGMDVVKSNIERLEGTVRLRTVPGQGTTVSLRVPLTMAITRCLLVRTGNEVLGIPTTAVEETTRIDQSLIQSIEGRLALTFRGEVLPVVYLADILWLARGETSEDKLPVAIMSSPEGRIGFIVEEHLGEQEMVIKGFDELLSNTRNAAGAAILGSGEVVVILHVADIISSARGFFKGKVSGSTPGEDMVTESKGRDAQASTVLQVLVVDDSMATRELERNILKSYGYEVDVAIDGIDALEHLGVKHYDLVVADVEMPRLDGFSLTSKIKKSDDLKDIPVIIITSLSSEQDRRRGLESGADAYISKNAFTQENLIETVRMVLGVRGK